NGIIEAVKGNNDKANELFEEALKITPKNHLATINQNILNDTKSEAEDIAQRSGSGKEMIDGAKIDDIQINRKDIRDTLDHARSHFVRLIAKRLDRSRLLINHV